MIEAGIVLYLAEDDGIAAVLGRRIFPATNPPDAAGYPYCTFRGVSSGHESTLDSTESGHKIIQFDVFSNVYGDGKTALKALRDALVGLIGMLPDGTRILSTERGNEQDNFNFDQRTYHSWAEYEFEYVEP